MLSLNYNEIASKYAQNRQLHPEVFKALLLTGSVEAGHTVLEVGCGTGNYIVSMQAATGCSCWGFDRSAGMVAKAKERGAGINFQLGDASAFGVSTGSFEFVFSVDLIHHLGRRIAYFQEMYRVLKPGGKACTVTDSEWIIRHRQPLTTYFPETVGPELRRYPATAELYQMMEQVGFKEITEKTVEFHYRLTDIRAYREKAFSALHLISAEAFQRGLDRMSRDLLAGPISGISRYLLLWGTK